MPNIDLSILNQRQTPAFYADVFANRPAAGFVGRIFVSTNTFAFYRDNGTGWDLIGGPGTGTITGSGASGQIALWNGASTIAGDTGLTYDGTANSLTASQFIVTGGLSTQFLKGDGSLDSNTYNTGSGASGQVTYWNGTNAITGNTNLFYDAGNSRLGVNTNVPSSPFDVHSSIASPIIHVNQTGGTNNTTIAFLNSGTGKWRIGSFYNAGAEDFGIFDVVGNIQPVTVKKTTGQVLIGTSTVGSGKLVVASATGDNGIQIVGATAPSLRIDSAESGPTKRAGFGIATATNNFIQGSADRDFCMFNGSTTASPILFGIYGTTNVQEAARISAARNLLVGTTTDSGFRLSVNGTTNLSNTVTIGPLGVAVPGLQISGNDQSNTRIRITNTGGSSFSLVTGNPGASNNGFAIYDETAADTRLYFSTSGAATFSNNVSVNNLATSANYKLGASGRAYFSGLNDKGIFISDSNSPAYVSLVGLNSAISSYNNVELRASGTDGQLYLTTAGNVVLNGTTDNGNRLQVNGSGSFNNSLLVGETANSGGDNIVRISNTGGTLFFTRSVLELVSGGGLTGHVRLVYGTNAMYVGTTTNSILNFITNNVVRASISNTGVFNLANIPTSAAGLSTGDVYSNAGILTIVP